jgi:hypothetical protein
MRTTSGSSMVISIPGPLLESGCGLQVRRQDRRCGFLDEKAACPSFLFVSKSPLHDPPLPRPADLSLARNYSFLECLPIRYRRAERVGLRLHLRATAGSRKRGGSPDLPLWSAPRRRIRLSSVTKMNGAGHIVRGSVSRLPGHMKSRGELNTS